MLMALLGGLAIRPASRPHRIRGKTDTELNASMSGDVETAGGGRQIELPLGLQVALGVHSEGARGHAPAVGSAASAGSSCSCCAIEGKRSVKSCPLRLKRTTREPTLWTCTR